MSIRPIDIITIAPKSQETSHLQLASQQRSDHAHEQLGVQYNSDIKHNSEQTVKATKGENKEYRYDAKEKGSQSYSGKKKKGNKQNEKNRKEEITRGSFDIKI